MATPLSSVEPPDLRRALLGWYDRHRRVLPWRAPPGQRAEPYPVWLSEIMLQQTTVVTVGPYFERFIRRWPDIGALARAPLDDVLHGWQGLGYYARARNLHRCAGVVSRDLGGQFPDTEDGLRALPGIGPYTAAAIAAIAFDRPASVVDGNVERVMARLYAVETPLPGAKPVLRDLAAALAPRRDNGRPGDYAQALMDLGATVCRPRRPACDRCPWAEACQARHAGIAETLPKRAPRAAKPVRRGVAFWAVRPDGAVLLRRRPETGLLGGMIEVPSTDWREAAPDVAEIGAAAPVMADWMPLTGIVRHTFTHFHLELSVHAATVAAGACPDAIWCLPDRLGDHALPSIMKKVVAHALLGVTL
ncbi:MAG: A/G-specific adenine glycosylase [Alphaproteobacteria bacterium]